MHGIKSLALWTWRNPSETSNRPGGVHKGSWGFSSWLPPFVLIFYAVAPSQDEKFPKAFVYTSVGPSPPNWTPPQKTPHKQTKKTTHRTKPFIRQLFFKPKTDCSDFVLLGLKEAVHIVVTLKCAQLCCQTPLMKPDSEFEKTFEKVWMFYHVVLLWQKIMWREQTIKPDEPACHMEEMKED